MIGTRGRTDKLALCLAAALGIHTGALAAASTALDAAVKKYYAGYTAEAIAMIEPLAVAGDADAQYLLGNILYTLSRSAAADAQGDPVKWYRMAAAQDSAQANYALGVIYNNRWLQSKRDEDAGLAQAYLQRALQLGEQKARAALEKLAAYRQQAGKAGSLTYTNESFASGQKPPPKPRGAPQAARLADALAGFERSGDAVADTHRLQELLNRLRGGGRSPGAAQDGDGEANVATLRQLLDGFESTDRLLSDLRKLLDYLDAASEIGTAPGSN
jgi:hypothetical protein